MGSWAKPQELCNFRSLQHPVGVGRGVVMHIPTLPLSCGRHRGEEYLMSEKYSEPYQTSEMKLFAKIVNV